jgi:hypothetical protein
VTVLQKTHGTEQESLYTLQKTHGAEQESLYTLNALIGRMYAQPMRDRQTRPGWGAPSRSTLDPWPEGGGPGRGRGPAPARHGGGTRVHHGQAAQPRRLPRTGQTDRSRDGNVCDKPLPGNSARLPSAHREHPWHPASALALRAGPPIGAGGPVVDPRGAATAPSDRGVTTPERSPTTWPGHPERQQPRCRSRRSTRGTRAPTRSRTQLGPLGMISRRVTGHSAECVASTGGM